MSIRRLRILYRYILYLLDLAGGYIDFGKSFLRRRRHITQVLPEGEIELGRNVALFIHFDRRRRLADHVLAYVRELRDCGFSVVFITNSGIRDPDSVAALRSICRAFVARRNVGYDFGAIRDVLFQFGLPRFETEQILIANDSVYGPLLPLSCLLKRIDFNAADVWGATESWQIRYHLQSYFLLAGRAAITSEAWRDFWLSVRQVSSKSWVVSRYEVGLTQRLLRAGLRCRSLWRYQDLVEHAVQELATLGERPRGAARSDPVALGRAKAVKLIRDTAAARKPMNPTAELWRQLLLTGFPFLKIELLRDNPANVEDISDWRAAVSHLEGEHIATIERDLQQKMRNRAP
jgi:hypothetical protein